MKNKKFLKITKEEMSRFPIKFNFIDYWKFDDSKDRIDNFNDPYCNTGGHLFTSSRPNRQSHFPEKN